MDIRKCKQCDRLYQFHGSKYCPSCLIELDKVFLDIREYIYENPDSTVAEVSENTGVDSEIIMEFLRDGKLELKEASILLECKSCGKPIKTGQMCSDCASLFEKEMKKGLNESSISAKIFSKGDKMHSADYFRNRRDK